VILAGEIDIRSDRVRDRGGRRRRVVEARHAVIAAALAPASAAACLRRERRSRRLPATAFIVVTLATMWRGVMRCGGRRKARGRNLPRSFSGSG